jgi:hypothetical protein
MFIKYRNYKHKKRDEGAFGSIRGITKVSYALSFEFTAKHTKHTSDGSERRAREVCFRTKNFSKRSDLLFFMWNQAIGVQLMKCFLFFSCKLKGCREKIQRKLNHAKKPLPILHSKGLIRFRR